MAITYAIVKQKHKGTIECRSEPGAGTEFVIRLPIAAQVSRELEVA